jgi:plasmid replication initiation protein
MTRTHRTPLVVALASALALAAVALLAGSSAASRMPSEKQWHRDVARVMKGSSAYVDSRVARRHGKLAINLDIDNSALASHYRRGTATPAVLRLAEHAHAEGVALLFNTARVGPPLKHARAELRKAGYAVTRVCGRTSAKEPVRHSKQRCRARFVRHGFKIIANVGNHVTDFSGRKNYGRAYRLPNYDGRLS